MRISDWSSDVCSSDLPVRNRAVRHRAFDAHRAAVHDVQPSAHGEFVALCVAAEIVVIVENEDPRRRLFCLTVEMGRGKAAAAAAADDQVIGRSEERRGGKEGVSKGRSRWWRYR